MAADDSFDQDIVFAQDLIKCTLCSNSVELYCKPCGLNICGGCAGRHMLSTPEKKHDIVKYDKKYLTSPKPSCPSHEDQICELFCEKCNIAVCATCISSKAHYNHSIVEISVVFKQKVNFIIQETKSLEEKIAPEYEKIPKDLDGKVKALINNNTLLKKEITSYGEELQKQIKETVNKYVVQIETMEKQDIADLRNSISRFQNITGEVNHAIQQNKEMLKANDVQIFDYQSVIKKFQKVPARINVTPPCFKPSLDKGKLFENIGMLSVSTKRQEDEYLIQLTEGAVLPMARSYFRELLPRPMIIATVECNYKELYKISCLSSEEAWISGNDKTMTRVNKGGSVLEVMKTKSGRSTNGIAVTKTGNLLYADCYGKKIEMVKKGKVKSIVKTEWKPTEVSCTPTGDILVSLWNDKPLDNKLLKVQRYSGDSFELKQEIQFDENDTSLFRCSGDYTALVTAENRNGDICIADWNARSLLILDKSGKLKTTYTGFQSKVFDPRYVATDSHGHILVSDYDNNCVHILNESGHLVSLIEYLRKPEGIDVDDDNNLWLVEREGKLKIIKYME
ncbi:uncharacterized protein LOC134243455 [Saccostrea cucullata]|uniref:uncharacterized protein LOC134243455 n=1 Tax=Saccostrea cuccullata TaxID=36930 RepID=UPI002ED4FE88